MPTPTYDLIEEKVLGSAAASVTFSSIPGTYKDLVLEMIITPTTAVVDWIQVNGDTAGNYSSTYMRGDGTNAQSGRFSNASYFYPSPGSTGSGIFTSFVNFQSYSSTNVYKSMLARHSEAGLIVYGTVGLWRSTNAITSIAIVTTSNTYASGSTFRLYGIAG